MCQSPSSIWGAQGSSVMTPGADSDRYILTSARSLPRGSQLNNAGHLAAICNLGEVRKKAGIAMSLGQWPKCQRTTHPVRLQCSPCLN